MQRRQFLRNTAMTAAALSCSQLFVGCTGIQRSDLQQSYGDVSGLGRTELEILRLASLAPNGHNTQPWNVTILNRHHWIIGSEETRWLPAVDPDQRETILSIGAFLENLTIAAAHFGLHAEYDVLAKNTREKLLVAVRLIEKSILSSFISCIETRRTIRSNFRSKGITSEDLRYITEFNEEQFHYFPPTSPAGKFLSDATLLANKAQCARFSAQKELSDWIRWSDDEAIQRMDGLTPETMEITGMPGWYVRNFYSKQDALTNEFAERSVEKVVEQVSVHGGWIVIPSSDSEVTTLLDTGRLLQRMLLRVKEKMIAVHPMTQMLEERQWKETIAQEIGISDRIQFILRVGYVSTYPEPVSLRRPPQWFIQN